MFDFGVCNSEIDPTAGDPNNVQEGGPCIHNSGDLAVYHYVFDQGPCGGHVEEAVVQYVTIGPCPGLGGPGGGDPGSGGTGGGGSGGYSGGSGGSSGNSQLATATSRHNSLKYSDPAYNTSLMNMGITDFDKLLDLFGPPGNRIGGYLKASNAYLEYKAAGHVISWTDIVDGAKLWAYNTTSTVNELSNGIEIVSSSSVTATPNEIFYKGGTVNRGNTEDLEHGFDGGGASGDIRLANKNVAQLFTEMRDLMTDFSTSDLEVVALDLVDYFDSNTSINNIYTNSTLSNAVRTSVEMRNFVKKYANKLNESFISEGFTFQGSIQLPQSDRPVFNSFNHSLSGLQIILNDTEETRVYRTNLTFDSVTKEWQCDLTIVVDDHFGLDGNDVRSYQWSNEGFAAWWRLQWLHNQIPFHTNSKMTFNVKGLAK